MKNLKFGIVILAFWMIGCSSQTNRLLVGDPDGFTKVGTSRGPFVEAFLEYAGPAERWSGPKSFMVHLETRNPEKLAIVVAPTLFKDYVKWVPQGRTLASKDALTVASTRDELAKLAAALSTSPADFRGCLYPIRVVLMREDHTVQTHYGCRGATGWPAALSRLAAKAIETSVYY